jgi:hypothetical protein
MTSLMIPQAAIRRHIDGSIDVAYYVGRGREAHGAAIVRLLDALRRSGRALWSRVDWRWRSGWRAL